MPDLKYNWLDDPFDERKYAEQLQEAHRYQRRGGCLLATMVVLALVLLGIPVALFFVW